MSGPTSEEPVAVPWAHEIARLADQVRAETLSGGANVGQLGGRALARSEQITGRERERLAALLAQRYQAGATIRQLAADSGRSFGWVRTLLLEAGVQLRGRGGDWRARCDPEAGR